MRSELPTHTRHKPPGTLLEEQVYIRLARATAELQDGLDRLLGPRGLSLTQYNVLRILRGAGDNGLCRNEVAQRLITRMPDVTRLLDRMEAAGLVSRIRSTDDRRLVNTTLTEKGRALVDGLDTDIARVHQEQLGHMTEAELRTLINLLDRARSIL